jgi:hypothetical protein
MTLFLPSYKSVPTPSLKNPLLSDEIVGLSFGKMAQESGRAVASSIHRSLDPARHKAEIKEHKVGTRPAVEVRVPSRDLYVMFVKSSTCGPDEPAKK